MKEWLNTSWINMTSKKQAGKCRYYIKMMFFKKFIHYSNSKYDQKINFGYSMVALINLMLTRQSCFDGI